MMKICTYGLLSSAVTLALLACSSPSTQKSPPETRPATQISHTSTVSQDTKSSSVSGKLQPRHHGARRAVIFTDSKTDCSIVGPRPGEILGGPAIGDALEFDAAVRKCAALGAQCYGITTDWYIGKPYTLMKAESELKADANSYAVSYLNECKQK